MRIVLIGAPASGKSRIGKKLARTLGLPFTDTDALIVREHGAISEIFASHGEARFRALERAAVSRALETDGIIAFGGGAVLDEATQRDIAAVPVVLLTVDAEAVGARLASGKRPLVTSIEAWQALVDARSQLYASLADVSFDTSNRPTEHIARDIAHWARHQHPTKESS